MLDLVVCRQHRALSTVSPTGAFVTYRGTMAEMERLKTIFFCVFNVNTAKGFFCFSSLFCHCLGKCPHVMYLASAGMEGSSKDTKLYIRS